MSRTPKLLIAALFVASVACYHATIDTGLTPSTQVVEKAWASGWIYGLVPPKTVETMAKCPNGVSKVETQLSFVNQLVNFLTLGIYTPMAIKVTCAQGGRSSITPGATELNGVANATAEAQQAVANRAARLSLQTGLPVYVQF